jgi:acetyltransferase-like isoleucine patch superfamily enzyme
MDFMKYLNKILGDISKRVFGKKLKKSSHANFSYEEKIQMGLDPAFHGNNKVRNIVIGNFSYVSYNSIVYNAEIGKYCSIGPNVVIGYGDHPTNLLSTSPFIYLNDTLNSKEKIIQRVVPHFKKVIIKNDVWIGANVSIKNGVVIGNGAVIGAGAVVLSNVADYEIVAGVPARAIKKRFDDEMILLLLELKWWDFDKVKLLEIKERLDMPDKDFIISMINKSYEL